MPDLIRDRLPRDFYDRPAQEVAPDLLGCVLEHESADGLVAVELSEVEAYAGEADPASHAYRGRTARNAVMFGPPGYAYVYFTYGMHYCVNVVCGPLGTAVAVLLRAGRIVVGEDLARARRTARTGPAAPGEPAGAARPLPGRPLADRELARGPARLCQALAIDRRQDGADLCAPLSVLRLRGPATPGPTPLAGGSAAVATGPRVGVRLGAEIPWRFWIPGDPTVSSYRPHAGGRAGGMARRPLGRRLRSRRACPTQRDPHQSERWADRMVWGRPEDGYHFRFDEGMRHP